MARKRNLDAFTDGLGGAAVGAATSIGVGDQARGWANKLGVDTSSATAQAGAVLGNRGAQYLSGGTTELIRRGVEVADSPGAKMAIKVASRLGVVARLQSAASSAAEAVGSRFSGRAAAPATSAQKTEAIGGEWAEVSAEAEANPWDTATYNPGLQEGSEVDPWGVEATPASLEVRKDRQASFASRIGGVALAVAAAPIGLIQTVKDRFSAKPAKPAATITAGSPPDPWDDPTGGWGSPPTPANAWGAPAADAWA